VIGQAAERIYTVQWLKDHGPQIAIILVLAVVVSWLGNLAVRRVRRRLESGPTGTQTGEMMALQRSVTLTSVMVTAVRIVVWTLAVLLILGELGINLGPLLAGAGIVGVALGFGAQSLVRDFLAGFFILFENQYLVGEQVEISAVGGTVRGRVEVLTFRTTWIRDQDGRIAAIPNGNVQVMSNLSRGTGRITIDVTVPVTKDTERLQHELEEFCGELSRDPGLGRLVSWGPASLGANPDGQGSVVLSVEVETRPSRREEVEREVRKRIGLRFPPPPAAAVPD
jgi:small-conductance mechanosensitive channel